MTAIADDFVAEEAHANTVIRADPPAYLAVDFERQPHTVLAPPAITIRSRVGGTQERGHRVGVRVVQLDAIEAGLAGAHGGSGEDAGQYVWQLANVRQVHVGDALAVAIAQRFKLALVEHLFDQFVRRGGEKTANVRVIRDKPAHVSGGLCKRRAMTLLQDKETREEFLFLRAALDGEEIDDLNEQARVAVTGAAHRFDQLAQARDEAVVADPEQRAAGDVANACRFDDNGAGLPFGEAFVPLKHIRRHEAVFGGAPRHHRRNPRATFELDATDGEG